MALETLRRNFPFQRREVGMVTFGRRRFLQIGLGTGGLAACGAIASSWSSRPLVEVRRAGRALGTTTEFCVLHEDRATAERAIDAAFTAIDLVEDLMSLYRPHGRVCELNRTGRLDEPHPWLIEVLRHAQGISQATDGAFDVTVQPLWLCWSQAAQEQRLPTDAELQAARQRVDWRALRVSPQRISLDRPGMQVTLNGIAQGFAADRAAAALREAGIEHALVNTGEVSALGRKQDGGAWTVGVQHPRRDEAYSALAKLAGRALSTSGDYATTFSPDRRHHHIVDPRLGYSPGELASATIVAPTALEADALSTAVLVLGADRGLRLLADRPGVEALLVFKDGRTRTTPGFPEEVVS
jgi:FAD:protein FMN transferase